MDIEEYERQYLKLKKEVEEAQKELINLKEQGYDINSVKVREATELWQNKLRELFELKR